MRWLAGDSGAIVIPAQGEMQVASCPAVIATPDPILLPWRRTETAAAPERRPGGKSKQRDSR
jgi:hypothetical protein